MISPNIHHSLSVRRADGETADGKTQPVLGWIDVMIKGQGKPIKLLIVPSISQNLILTVDF